MAWSYSVTDLNTTTASGRPSKKCNSCEETKIHSDFPTNTSSKDGLYSFCRDCKRKKDLLYRQNNRKSLRDRNKKYYDSNKINWFVYNSDRRVRFRKAAPAWLTKGQKQEILNFYLLAQECRTLTGDVYHVDHIVPLKGENVCGLHVPWNLQVLPADINLAKANKFEGV
jgi:hypothetical protein